MDGRWKMEDGKPEKDFTAKDAKSAKGRGEREPHSAVPQNADFRREECEIEGKERWTGRLRLKNGRE
jgi:hypothetical protein